MKNVYNVCAAIGLVYSCFLLSMDPGQLALIDAVQKNKKSFFIINDYIVPVSSLYAGLQKEDALAKKALKKVKFLSPECIRAAKDSCWEFLCSDKQYRLSIMGYKKENKLYPLYKGIDNQLDPYTINYTKIAYRVHEDNPKFMNTVVKIHTYKCHPYSIRLNGGIEQCVGLTHEAVREHVFENVPCFFYDNGKKKQYAVCVELRKKNEISDWLKAEIENTEIESTECFFTEEEESDDYEISADV